MRNVEIALTLLQHKTPLSHSIDILPYVDPAYEIALSGKFNRGASYGLIALYASDTSFPQHPKTLPLLDKLNSLIESASNDEYKILPSLIFALVNDIRNDVKAHWVKIMNKVAQTIFRIFNRYKDSQTTTEVSDVTYDTSLCVFLFEMVEVFLASELRSLWIPHLTTIKEMSLYTIFSQYIEYATNEYDLFYKILGLSMSLTSSEVYIAFYEQMLSECVHVLHHMQLPIIKSKNTIQKSVLNLQLSNKKQSQVSGASKVLYYVKCFEQLCQVLQQVSFML